jgi:GGDEF domain-containing protein
VARYSPDEFVVVMPQTSLTGATIFAQRLLDVAHQELGLVVFGGIVEGQGEDTPDKLLSRADSALYSARSEGDSCLYQHTGKSIRPHDTKPAIDTADLSMGVPDELREPVEVSY